MDWWLWFTAGLLLLGLEVFTFAFFFFFIALSFFLTGLLASLGLIEDLSLQLIFAAIASVLFLLFFRPFLKGKMSSAKSNAATDIVGETVVINEDIAPGDYGKGTFRGSSWQVRNEKSETLFAKSRQKISATESLTLIIE